MRLIDAFNLAFADILFADELIERGTMGESFAVLGKCEAFFLDAVPSEMIAEAPAVSAPNANSIRQYLDAPRLREADAKELAAWLDASIPSPPVSGCERCDGEGCEPTDDNPGCAWTQWHAPTVVSIYGQNVNVDRTLAAIPFLECGGRIQAGVYDGALIVKGDGWTWVLMGVGKGTPTRSWPETEASLAAAPVVPKVLS